MLEAVPRSKATALLKQFGRGEIVPLQPDLKVVLERAEAMLRDENLFFTFPYQTRLERPWEYDPFEQKHWPRRHYTEQKLHGPDTPRDVKIVWEINRFKDLTTLSQAALLTGDEKYAREAERRILSWIEENPFAGSINWASALEISIRLLSWTATLVLLRDSGFEVHSRASIARSVYEQAAYLAADLSMDKVVPTNHLIGEAAGLFVLCNVWDFPDRDTYSQTAREILEREILRQTFADGATREATSWYHQFVTHFFDLADRVSTRELQPMSAEFQERLSKMKTYLSALTVNGEVIRYGDADDGWAIYFEGDADAWKTYLFGPATTTPAFEHGYFPEAEQAAIHMENSFAFVRGGEFGMGGAGYSSHAHDDYLSPVIYLGGLPVVTDPGTYVYNGDKESRARFRGETAHNGLKVGRGSEAVQRMNFGWHRVRPNARLSSVEFSNDYAIVLGKCAEWNGVSRKVMVGGAIAIVHDAFEHEQTSAEWRFHLDPQWKHEFTTEQGSLGFSNKRGDHVMFVFKGQFDTKQIETYDFSPSYRVEQKALVIHLTAQKPLGAFEVRIALGPTTE